MGQRLPFIVIGVICLALVGLVVVAGEFQPAGLPNVIAPPTGTGPPGPGPNWTRLSTSESPSTDLGMLAYLPTTGQMLYVDSGGACGSSSTWAFAGGSWDNLTPVVGPGPQPARGLGGLQYDGTDGYMVLFGGRSACGVDLNDTWTFANHTWTHVVTANAPPPLYGFAMTYDASDGYVLLTGGCCIHGVISRETWSYAQGTWTNLSQFPTPIVDLNGTMTYDPTLGEVVYVGGYASGFVSQATWFFHAGQWLRLYPGISPSNRAGEGLTYDAALTKDVLVGGYTKLSRGHYINLTDTWDFGGGNWHNLTAGLTSSPPSVNGHDLMSYDPVRHEIILFAGTNQTWTFGLSQT